MSTVTKPNVAKAGQGLRKELHWGFEDLETATGHRSRGLLIKELHSSLTAPPGILRHSVEFERTDERQLGRGLAAIERLRRALRTRDVQAVSAAVGEAVTEGGAEPVMAMWKDLVEGRAELPVAMAVAMADAAPALVSLIPGDQVFDVLDALLLRVGSSSSPDGQLDQLADALMRAAFVRSREGEPGGLERPRQLVRAHRQRLAHTEAWRNLSAVL